jgi:multidrug efflux system membrane fusion protein
VPEQGLERFAVGRELAVELWARPANASPAPCASSRPPPIPTTRTFAARVAFAAPQGVELGQSARVYARVDGDSRPRLPLSALAQKDGQAAVWVVDPKTHRCTCAASRSAPMARTACRCSPACARRMGGRRGAHLLLEGRRVTPIDRDNRRSRWRGRPAPRPAAAR